MQAHFAKMKVHKGRLNLETACFTLVKAQKIKLEEVWSFGF